MLEFKTRQEIMQDKPVRTEKSLGTKVRHLLASTIALASSYGVIFNSTEAANKYELSKFYINVADDLSGGQLYYPTTKENYETINQFVIRRTAESIDGIGNELGSQAAQHRTYGNIILTLGPAFAVGIGMSPQRAKEFNELESTMLIQRPNIAN